MIISKEGAIVIAVVVAITIATNSLNIQSAIASSHVIGAVPAFKSIDSDVATVLSASAISVSVAIASSKATVAKITNIRTLQFTIVHATKLATATQFAR